MQEQHQEQSRIGQLIDFYIDIYFLERICQLHYPFKTGPVLLVDIFWTEKHAVSDKF